MFPITKSWYELLKNELESNEHKAFEHWLAGEYQNKVIYPQPKNVFNALNLVDYSDVKVVIIGQDPYHNPSQAHGLSFSVENDVLIPPSLQNIFKELHSDANCYIPKNCGNLTKWARQGVLLLNSVLTVEQNKPNSHKGKGWEKITGKIVQLLNARQDPVIFLLWGNNAKTLGKKISDRHFVLTAVHPSPMSANQGGWFGCKHFSQTNEILLSLGKTPIDWQIDNF